MSMGNNSRSSLDSKPPLMGLSHDDWDKFVVIAFCCKFVVIAFYSFVVIAFSCGLSIIPQVTFIPKGEKIPLQ